MRSFNKLLVILAALFVFTNFIPQNAQAYYTRYEAYQYLKQNVLSGTTTGYLAHGSVDSLAYMSEVICGMDTVTSPTYMSWLFFIDREPHSLWDHPATLYFVDINMLSNYTSAQVCRFVENIDMEGIEFIDIEEDYVDWENNQDGGLYEYPDPDPHLKALLIASGNTEGDSNWRWENGRQVADPDGLNEIRVAFYYDLVMWYVMLKNLGYGDITILIGGHNDNQIPRRPNLQVYDPEHILWPLFDHSENDMDHDGNDETIGDADKQSILSAIGDLAENIDPLDRVAVYITSHGYLNNGVGSIGTYSGGPISSDEFYEALEPLNQAAELFVALEGCHSAAMFNDRADDYEDWSHAHLISAALDEQTNVDEKNITYRRTAAFAWEFCSAVLGYYPWVGDPWPDIQEEPWHQTIQPWRKGNPVEYVSRDRGTFFDHWEEEDRNDDGVRSFREAFEFAWAKAPFSSVNAPWGFNTNRFYQVNANAHQLDFFYFWPGSDTKYSMENDSAGSVTFIGRGGDVNWLYEDPEGQYEWNWNAENAYVIAYPLNFPAMQNPPTTTINGVSAPVQFYAYPDIAIRFGREVGVDNAVFTKYLDGAPWSEWEGLRIENTNFDMQNGEVTDAYYGIKIDNNQDPYDINLEDITISDCYCGVYLRNEDENAVNNNMDNLDISDCYYGVQVYMTPYFYLSHSDLLYNEVGLRSSYTYVSQVTNNMMCVNDQDGIQLSHENYILIVDNNTIFHNTYSGIYIYGDDNYLMMEKLEQDDAPNNEIWENEWYGIEIGSGANGTLVMAGNVNYERGWNYIFDNDLGAVRNDLDNMTVEAEGNYWGPAPHPVAGDFVGDGDVDYLPFWQIDGANEDIRELVGLFISGEFADIPDKCSQTINRHPDSNTSLYALGLWYSSLWRINDREESFDEIHNHLMSGVFDHTRLRSHSELLTASYEERAGNCNSAINRLRALTNNENISEDIKLSAYQRMADIYIYSNDDPISALGILQTIINRYPESRYAVLAESQMNSMVPHIDGHFPVRPKDESTIIPLSINLSAYPNPFNSSTTIEYRVGSDSNPTTISLYDLSGRLVQTLVEGRLTPGNYRTTVDAKNLAAGVYVVRMEADPPQPPLAKGGADSRNITHTTQIRKVVVVK